jgi:dienelactone hydrolase
MTRRLVLYTLLASLAAVPASAAYRNPTPGSALVLQIPGMHKAQVRRDVVYQRVGRRRLRMDVYRPRGAPRSRRLPVVLVGGPPAFRAGRDSGQKVGWGQLIAASGLAGAVFDIRSDNILRTPRPPSLDVAAAISFLRARGAALGLDPGRMCTLGFSIGTAPWHLWAAMREPQPYVRCNVAYYGPMDFRDLAERFSADRAALLEYEAATLLQRRGASIPPLLIARAGEDDPAINDSIDRFLVEARRLGAPVEHVVHPTGPHGFDVSARGAASRRIIRRTLAFFRQRLLAPSLASLEVRRPPPLRLLETCIRRAERRGIVRFRAADGVRLIGVILGRGRNVVVLAHQGGGGAPGDLCAWVPYARTLRAGGYRVLVFDHRAFGSSDESRSNARYRRVDLDVIGAVRLMRARGATRVVLGGASLGGAAVVGAGASLRVPVQGVFTIGGTHTYGNLDALRAARRLTVPVLFVAAQEDGEGRFADEARQMYDASPSQNKRLEIFPGAAHGAPQLRDRPVRALVDGWIRERFTP